MTDWEDINKLHTQHKVAKSIEEAVRMAILAGNDMSMVPNDFSFTEICLNLTKRNDQEFVQRVDDAVRRILKVKEKLGLWSNSSLYPVASEAQKVGNNEFHAKNLEAARETIILAKNKDNFLPLKKDDTKKILVTGPTGNLLKCLNGGWTYTWQGDIEDNNKYFGRDDKKTLFDAILNKKTAGVVYYKQGVTFDDKTNDIDATVELAKAFDIIVLAVGEQTYTEAEGNINNLLLNKEQYALADALFELNKPVILVVLGGRPRVITDIANKAQAVVLGFLPGNRGGEAIADIIFGDYNPNGRLPLTYPLGPNGFMTYDRKNLEVFVDKTDDAAKSKGAYENLFPFGHGLSYTEFKYSNLKLSKHMLELNELLTVSVDIENVGQRDGKETVILYLNDEYGSVSRPVKQVKGFRKISLAKNEKQTVSFTLSNEDFSFINQNNKRVVEDGDFNVFVNDYDQSARFTVVLRNGTGVVTTIPVVVTTSSAANIFMTTFSIIFSFTILILVHLKLK